jgi:hypothetical protein
MHKPDALFLTRRRIPIESTSLNKITEASLGL